MPRARSRHQSVDHEHVLLVGIGSIIFVFIFCLWFFQSARSFPLKERPLKVWMLDIGQGDSFLVESPTGEQLLIDGGPSDAVLSKLGTILPPWDRTLDAVLITHQDADHVTGLVSVLDRYKVSAVYESGAGSHSPQAQAFVDRVAKERATHRLLSSGDMVSIGEATLTVMWPDRTLEGEYPEDRNDFSLNVLLEYGDTTVLLTGDSREDAESAVGSRAGDIDVLKVAHHGSLTSTNNGFLLLVRPEVALISVESDNQYGLPHPIVLERLNDIGARIYRTDLDGDVLLTSYGAEPRISSKPLPF